MKSPLSSALAAALLLLLMNPALSQYRDAGENQKQAQTLNENRIDSEDPKKRKKFGVVPMGLPYYSPDTSGAVAAYVVLYYNPNPEDPASRPNELALYGTYTLLNQMAFGTDYTIYPKKDYFLFKGTFAFAKYPQYFWGPGPSTGEWQREKYTPLSHVFEPAFLFKIVKHLYAGPVYHYAWVKTWQNQHLRALDLHIYKGSEGTRASGIGGNVNWDNRDSTFYPHRGFYADVKSFFYRKELGSEYNWSRLEIDFRTFIQLYRDHVLTFQSLSKLTWGSVPISLMPQIGGMNIMRGYIDGRYMDNVALSMQIEYRFPIYWRFGGVLFGSVGTVAPRLDEVKGRHFRYAFGPGIRFTVDRAEHINLRLDVGFDEKLEPSFYFTAKEAF